MWVICRQFLLLLFVLGLALQGWRGFCCNSIHLMKGLLQIANLKEAELKLEQENHQMYEELAKLQEKPGTRELLRASEELDLVSDPSNQIVIKYQGPDGGPSL